MSVALVGVTDGVKPLVLELEAAELLDEAQLAAQVRAHNDLLVRALETGAVVPFRFGTTFDDRAVLDDWLAEHREQLERELEHLRGKDEWSVEFIGPPSETEPEAYLAARLATAVRPDDRRRLAAASEDSAGDAYLVARDRKDAFAAVVAELEAEGHALRITGPWPPYTFARLP